jgi:murein DD-endopeptidase MepM/ murein hydrolase activator NlpD
MVPTRTQKMSCQLCLGRQQVTVTFSRKRGRPPKKIITRLIEISSQLKRIATDKRFTGHPLSRVLRRVVENKKTKQVFGANLIIVAFLAGIAVPPTSALSHHSETEITLLSSPNIFPTSEYSFRIPVDSFPLTISQGYSVAHPAIDIEAEIGEPVYSFTKGVVEETVSGCANCSAYGNYIIVNHGSGFKSLYAHLTKVVVKKNEEVDKNTVIGTIGASGRATGPHLHFEIHDQGQPLNPLKIFH